MSVQLLSNDGHGKVVPCSFRREAGPSFLHWPSCLNPRDNNKPRQTKRSCHIIHTTRSLHPYKCYLPGKASTIATRTSGSAASARRKHPRHMNGYVTWCRLVWIGRWWMDGNMVVWGNGDMPLVGRWRQSRRGVWSMKERRYWSSNSSHLDLSLSYRGQNAWI